VKVPKAIRVKNNSGLHQVCPGNKLLRVMKDINKKILMG
jgi:hypothetical protein